MSIITKVLKQKAVYWAFTGYDNHGQPTYAAAVQIACRWVDSHEEIINAKGEKQISNATVMVGVDTPPDGVLWLGAIGGLTDAANPFNNPDAWPIIKFDKTPNFRATESLRIATL